MKGSKPAGCNSWLLKTVFAFCQQQLYYTRSFLSHQQVETMAILCWIVTILPMAIISVTTGKKLGYKSKHNVMLVFVHRSLICCYFMGFFLNMYQDDMLSKTNKNNYKWLFNKLCDVLSRNICQSSNKKFFHLNGTILSLYISIHYLR